MESTHPAPTSQAPTTTNPNAPRRLYWGLSFAQQPGWTFTVWVQANGLFFATGSRGGLSIDGDALPVALDALNDCHQRVFDFRAAEVTP